MHAMSTYKENVVVQGNACSAFACLAFNNGMFMFVHSLHLMISFFFSSLSYAF
jgi:hypothetical protein